MKAVRKIRTFTLGRDIKLGRELATGGEGKIYAIVGHPQYVAKIFHKPTAEKTAKLREMLAHPPRDPERTHLKHISIAWPTAIILNERSRCVGFIMPYIEQRASFPLLKLYNPQDRKRLGLSFTWEYLVNMAYNLTCLVEELHRRGYVVGDLNESNILVTSTALITMVDCDSVQVPMRRAWWEWMFFWHRRYYRCAVGKPEYTAPELQGRKFSEVDRQKKHDNFALAVILFLMLMEGRHPYAGVWQGDGPPPTIEQSIRNGDFPYGRSKKLTPTMSALPFQTLPPHLQKLMLATFASRFRIPFFRVQRPGASEWKHALELTGKLLVHCDRNNAHVYSRHLTACPWCQRMRIGLLDPFPPASVPVPQQQGAVPQNKTVAHRFRTIELRAAQVILFLLCVLVYGVELYLLPTYSHWIMHFTWQIAALLWLLVTLAPAIILLTLLKKISYT